MTRTQDLIDGATSADGDALTEVCKRLEQVRQGLERLRAGDARAGGAVEKTDADDWPSDLNNPDFRAGVRKREEPSTWGSDPAQVRTPEVP